MMQFQAGDLIACYGTDLPSRTISAMTSSIIRAPRFGPSHVAVIAFDRSVLADQQLNGPVWCESTTMCRHKCRIKKRRVSGVQFHDPELRIADYEMAGGSVEVYRLNGLHKLNDNDEWQLWHSLKTLRGSTYDMRGAILSGTRAYQKSILFPSASLESLFCSELVAALLQRLNRMNHSNPARYNPARLIRELVASGKYAKLEGHA